MLRIIQSSVLNILLFALFHVFGFDAIGQVFSIHLEDSVYSAPWIALQNIDSGYAHSGDHFSLADSSHPYGLGFESGFPEELRGANTVLLIEGWIKSNNTDDEALFVVSLIDDEKQVFWKGINLKHFIQDENKWYRFTDSLFVPAGFTKHSVIKSYLWNNDKRDEIAIDDLN